jgi:hypothetical protein
MLAMTRRALALFAFSVATSSPGALAQSAPKTSVLAGGTTEAARVAKVIWLQATQTAAGSLDATGSALMMQADSSGLFGDFSLIASVACLRAEGTRVTVGLQLVWGLGTALGHAGDTFYVVLESGGGSGPDRLDNGGFEGGAPNCNTEIGVPGGGAPFITGQVIITAVP